MSSEENKSVARRFYEILAAADVDAAGQTVAEDYVNHNALPGQTPGLEGYINAIKDLNTAFGGLQITIQDQIAEGDKVATRYSVSGTHQGEFMGVSATNQPVSWSALVLQRVADGKIQESWLYWDQMAMMQQLGVISVPGEGDS